MSAPSVLTLEALTAVASEMMRPQRELLAKWMEMLAENDIDPKLGDIILVPAHVWRDVVAESESNLFLSPSRPPSLPGLRFSEAIQKPFVCKPRFAKTFWAERKAP